MRRRDFIKVIVAGSAVVWPLPARAQQRAFQVVGLLSSRSPAVDMPLIAVIRQGLNEAGFARRNSSFSLQGKSAAVRQVGHDLGVRYVLEGSVRKAGNRVRMTAQLIDATSGFHVWAEL